MDRAAPALALLLLLALAPSGAAQSGVGGMAPPPADTGYEGGPVVVPLFGHIYDLLQPVPINTQPMIDLDLARGFGAPTVTGLPGGPPTSLRFYSSPGLVEYNETDENGLPRYHPERGLSYDLLLDTSKPIMGHWFMSAKAADVPQAGQTDGPEAGTLAGLSVRMTLRLGDDIGADLDAGDVIAQGTSALDDPSTWIVNGEAVEFVVDMGTPSVDRIRGNDSFNVKVEWFNAEAPDGSLSATQRDWILHTGANYPNRVEVNVANPLALYSIQPTPVGNDLVTIHAVLNSPFGNYDVDTKTVQLIVDGPTRPTTIGAPLVVQRNFEHNHHYAPVEVTWSWPFTQDNAKPGTYTVTVRAQNLQHTAMVEKTATFVIPEAGHAVGFSDTGEQVTPQQLEAPPADTPGASLALVLGLVVAVALGLSRRVQRL